MQKHLRENWDGIPNWIIWAIMMTDQETPFKQKNIIFLVRKNLLLIKSTTNQTKVSNSMRQRVIKRELWGKRVLISFLGTVNIPQRVYFILNVFNATGKS